MAISKPLLSSFVIILIILPEMAALEISPAPGSAGDIESGPDNTARADPLHNFKRYRGGFNVTNKHYWSSVIFTGASGYAIGLLCLVCGLVYAGTTKFCCKTEARRKMKRRYACNDDKSCDIWLILIAILITILAVAATGIVLGGSAKFYSEARGSVNIIIRTANEASQTLHNTTGALKDIKSKLEGSGVGDQASDILTSTSHKLDAESAVIEMQASKNRHRIHRGLNIVFIITTVTISFNSVAAASLSVCGVLRLRRALYFLIVLCWLMTVMCWLLFGVYFFLEKFSNDACKALAKFEEDPYNNSLSSMLPCGQLVSAKRVMSHLSEGIYNLVNEVNANISLLQGSSVQVCNPFSAPPLYSYQPQNCPSNTVRIADIPKVLSVFMCSDSGAMCNRGEFSGMYERVEAYTSSIQDLLDVYPSMLNLVDCQSLKQAFSHILVQHCQPLHHFARITWAALVFLAVLMVFLLLLCAFNPKFPSKTAASATSSAHTP